MLDVGATMTIGLKLDQSVLVLGVRVGEGAHVVIEALIEMEYTVGITVEFGGELDHVGWQALI